VEPELEALFSNGSLLSTVLKVKFAVFARRTPVYWFPLPSQSSVSYSHPLKRSRNLLVILSSRDPKWFFLEVSIVKYQSSDLTFPFNEI